MIFDLSELCVEPNMRECGERVVDCPAWVAGMERETRAEVARYWEAGAVDYITAHMLALMWHESRMNRCAVGPGGRAKLGLDSRWQKYAEAEVVAAAERAGKNARVDLGPAQILVRYARSPRGGRATPAELVSRATAIPTAVYNLHRRQVAHPSRPEPWGYWPGNRYDMRYVRRIGRMAAKLIGGSK